MARGAQCVDVLSRPASGVGPGLPVVAGEEEGEEEEEEEEVYMILPLTDMWGRRRRRRKVYSRLTQEEEGLEAQVWAICSLTISRPVLDAGDGM